MTRRTLWIILIGLGVCVTAGVAMRHTSAYDKEFGPGLYMGRLYERMTDTLRKDPEAPIGRTLVEERAEMRCAGFGDRREIRSLTVYFNDSRAAWIGEGAEGDALLLLSGTMQDSLGRHGYLAYWHGGAKVLSGGRAGEERLRMRRLPDR